jgi:putative spermidine/putrescine transport system ATP-binding protein
MATTLALRGVVKYYGRVLGVGPLSLNVPAGVFVSLLGPSGCGKSTTLRLIVGLEALTAGSLLMDGTEISTTPIHRRDIGLVFQHYALFPHLTVFENVAFGLRYRGVSAEDRAARVRAVLDLVRLPGLESRYPQELSGGQQQRVALARALVIQPRLLLLDEPLSNLDQALRQQMQSELKRIQSEVGITTVYVTHDQTEALALSDRIAVIFRGHLHQYGTADDIYERPATAEVAQFIGETNLFPGRLETGAAHQRYVTSGGLVLALVPGSGPAGVLLIRPHRVRLVGLDHRDDGVNVLPARVERLVFGGDLLRATVRLDSGTLIQLSKHNTTEAQQQLRQAQIRIQMHPTDLRLVPMKGDGPRAGAGQHA